MAQVFEAASRPFIQAVKALRGRKTSVRPRIDVVSPQLCDDALERLAPSLRPYKGCTIIDINPGLGLWSSKLHDVLKPTRHILAEPPGSPFVPRSEALVAQEGSSYQLLDWEDTDLWRPDRYLAEGLLPAFNTSKPPETNHSILIVANTAMRGFGRFRTKNRKTHLVLMDWAHDIRRRLGFHTGGSVRMLLWSPASETTHALPHSVLLRTKLSLLLEMTCHVEEIVASNLTGQGRQRQRDQHVQLMSERRVVEKMRKSGVTMPPGRETELYKQVVEEDDDDEHHASGTLIRTRAWHKELEDLRQRFADGQFTKAEGLPQGYRGKIPKGATVTPEFDRLSQLEANLTHVRKRTGMTDQLLQEQAEIDALDARAYNCSPSDPQHHAILKELDERKELLHKHMDDFRNLHIRNEFEHFNHDRKAFSQTPPLLLWDRREADPLKAYDEEFVPESGLCLLDIQPKHPQPCTMTPAEFDLFFPFVSTWWLSGRENLTTLEQIAPGAIDALVPQVPALTDPRRGGERDIRDLPLYRLTPEMACGIMKAWVNWPFKRDLVDVLRISGDSKDKESDNPLSAHPRF